MNYKVLYRKYRPKTFDEIVGQNNIINLLKDSIINNKMLKIDKLMREKIDLEKEITEKEKSK